MMETCEAEDPPLVRPHPPSVPLLTFSDHLVSLHPCSVQKAFKKGVVWWHARTQLGEARNSGRLRRRGEGGQTPAPSASLGPPAQCTWIAFKSCTWNAFKSCTWNAFKSCTWNAFKCFPKHRFSSANGHMREAPQ